MKNILSIICLFMAIQLAAQTPVKNLLSIVTVDSLKQAPYSAWFNKEYESYHPTPEQITALKKIDWTGVKVNVYFGSWCGDSKREVPRFLKVIDSIGISREAVVLIGLDNSDSAYKQSPQGEEKGQGIFRVPTIVVTKKGKEINRINEYPSLSMEWDLRQIVTGQHYVPNYSAFAQIKDWMANGTLVDINSNTGGMANTLRAQVANEFVLNSLANLLILQNRKEEAMKLFRINYNLFPEKLMVQKALGEQYLKRNEKEKAVTFLELALKNSKDKEFDDILVSIYKAKGL